MWALVGLEGVSVRVLAVLLAAGAGERWAGPGHKLTTMFRGKPVVVRAIEHVVASGLDVLVVHGAVDLTALARGCGARVVLNPRWIEGQASSLGVACDVATREGFDAIVVGLGDQPLLRSSAWSAVAGAADDLDIVVATYDGVRGHPVRLAASTWPLLDRTADRGAGQLLRNRPDLVREVACEGNPADIDTMEDLRRWS
ncbi:MAG: nucleotidyltransferase family protein [Actinobacteria bacterium]|nr:nucleotidyltransferase family protein [Actinomycetota bacterium]